MMSDAPQADRLAAAASPAAKQDGSQLSAGSSATSAGDQQALDRQQPVLSQAAAGQGGAAQEPSSMAGWSQQVKGNLEYAWGAVTGSQETKEHAERVIAEGKAEKHLARAEEHRADAAVEVLQANYMLGEALREEGKAEKKLGKAFGNEELVQEGEEKKQAGEVLKAAVTEAVS